MTIEDFQRRAAMLKARRAALDARSEKTLASMKSIAAESCRCADVAHKSANGDISPECLHDKLWNGTRKDLMNSYDLSFIRKTPHVNVELDPDSSDLEHIR